MNVLEYAILIPAGLFLALVLWNMLAWPIPGAPENSAAPAVTIAIPARDEEDNIGACLDATLRNAPVSEILVYDDHSSDRTAGIVHAYATEEPRVRLVPPRDLPDGWCGKPFACAQLACEARGEWVVFLDADARLAPDAVDRMLAAAVRRKATFLSCWPGLACQGFWERLLMPMLNFCVFTLFPAPLSLVRRDANLGLAHGACILVNRAAYERVGGHQAVREEIFEDTQLARTWRERGEWGVCLDGRHIVQVRMYDSLAGIWRGFQKNFYPAFRHDLSFALFLLLHVWCFLAPFILLPVAMALGTPASWAASAAVLAVLGMRAAMALRFGYAWWACLLHPVAETMFVALGCYSFWRCRVAGGVEWKGRSYRGRGAEATEKMP